MCEYVRTKAEASEIARKLISTLAQYNRMGRSKLAVGLAANQIGIFKQVCVVVLKEVPVVLVNPRMTALSEVKVPYQEGCLSLPGVVCTTYRYPRIHVESDNLLEQVFGPKTPEEWYDKKSLLTSIVIQHEVGHLSGKIITDFQTEDYCKPEEWLLWRPEHE